MENVVAFNNELSGLYESKPPISKAKMAAITKAAMRGIKFYKHVVQSVEKFILKCKPEYKVPGLYVIDSIVRQSRHQFGAEKDVFAPRFARNVKDTFANLFRCAPEDKSRIIRVLNLWQKNNVFAPDVIQPLFDLADPNHPIYQMQPSAGMQDLSMNGLNTSGGGGGGGGLDTNAPLGPSGEEKLSVTELSIVGHPKSQNALDQNTIRQLQHIQQLLIRQSANENNSATSTAGGVGGSIQSDSVKFNKKVLDYDYDDEDEDDKSASPHVPNLLDSNNLTQLLKDPNVLRQLQTLQNFQKFKQEEKHNKHNDLEAFKEHIQSALKGSTSSGQDNLDLNSKEVEFVSEQSQIEVINLDGNDSRSPSPDRDRYKRRRSRSRSRSRDRSGRDRDRRRRSRSRTSRSRSPRGNRRRNSRERDRDRNRDKEKEKEKEREYERERRRKGLPELKKEHLSVCSTTLWVGHLSKLVHQEELSDTFGKYGDIVSIDMIVPRGCAFIVMHRRQDAHKAMSALKSHKLQGRTITISWAAGKGVKSKEWKDFWDLELGVTYIPWDKLNHDTELDVLEEGGMFDEDSMPSWIKEKITQSKIALEKPLQPAGGGGGGSIFGMDGVPNIDTSQPPPQPGGLMPGVPMGVPPFSMGGVPRLMTQMGVPMPGLPLGPPNMVPGLPPHHMMMPPGFPPIPVDKSVPPPNAAGVRPDGLPPGFMGIPGMPPPHMALPPQFSAPPAGINLAALNPGASSDDQMDIEMEDEDSPADGGGAKIPPQVNFNQPPPLFPGGFPNADSGSMGDGGGRRNDRDDFGGRERNRGNERERSRWGGRNDRDGPPRENRNRDGSGGGGGDGPWENGGAGQFPGRAAPGNIPPLDLNTPPQRPNFFDERRGGGDDFNDDRRGGPQREFFNNMGNNRFGPPGNGNQMQMRGGPPQFGGARMGGPMFMRGQGNRDGPQGPGGNFNPFDREDRGRMRGGQNDRRSGGGGGGGRSNNWRDDDDGGNFKRRGGRFQDRDDGPRDRDRGSRDRNSRDRSEIRSRDRRDSDRQNSRNRRSSTSNPREEEKIVEEKPKTVKKTHEDTEEDWDQELSEHQIESKASSSAAADPILNENAADDISPVSETEFVEPTPPHHHHQQQTNKEEESSFAAATTPLYDEPVEGVPTSSSNSQEVSEPFESNAPHEEEEYSAGGSQIEEENQQSDQQQPEAEVDIPEPNEAGPSE